MAALLGVGLAACASDVPAPWRGGSSAAGTDTGDPPGTSGTGSTGAATSGATTGADASAGFAIDPDLPGDEPENPVDGYADDIEPIWNRNCVIYCHDAAFEEGGLDLDWGRGYDQLVEQPSGQADMLLVEPGSPEGSYLMHKLDGTHLEAGGEGVHMPARSPELLPADTRDRVREWISLGAPP